MANYGSTYCFAKVSTFNGFAQRSKTLFQHLVSINFLHGILLSIEAIPTWLNEVSTHGFLFSVWTFVFGASGFTMIILLYIGLPLVILPFIFSSGIISYWLYREIISQSFSYKKSLTTGILIGSISGLLPFISVNGFDFLYLQSLAINFIPGLAVLPIISGGVAGYLLMNDLIRIYTNHNK